MKRYARYKDSGIEWLGDIPEHWELKRLKRFAKICNGQAHTNVWDEKGEYPIIGTGGVFGYANRYLHPGNSVILGRKGTIDRPQYIENPFWCTDTTYYTEIFEQTHPKYFYYLCSTINFDLYKYGSAVPSMTQEVLNQIPFAYPPLSEQIAIADFLDRKTAELDSLIEKKTQLIRLYEEEKAAIINQAVTRGLDPQVSLKPSGIDWLGNIPAHWEVKKLKYIADLKSGNSITSELITQDGDYPVYGGNGLRGYYHSYTHEGNYVLIGRQGALCGNINYAFNRFWASEHAVVATLKDKYEYKWFGELLRTMNLNQYSVSAAQPGLAVDKIKNLAIPIPPIPEQTAIVAHIETECARIDAIIARFRQQIDLFKEYRVALISEAVTGKIDVREV